MPVISGSVVGLNFYVLRAIHFTERGFANCLIERLTPIGAKCYEAATLVREQGPETHLSPTQVRAVSVMDDSRLIFVRKKYGRIVLRN